MINLENPTDLLAVSAVANTSVRDLNRELKSSIEVGEARQAVDIRQSSGRMVSSLLKGLSDEIASDGRPNTGSTTLDQVEAESNARMARMLDERGDQYAERETFEALADSARLPDVSPAFNLYEAYRIEGVRRELGKKAAGISSVVIMALGSWSGLLVDQQLNSSPSATLAGIVAGGISGALASKPIEGRFAKRKAHKLLAQQ
ncbi:MAG: hypothetical protein QG623_541 [Patescibacteria group bacterium]|nr:hypothetical protein [Patescibacteria group bacterium]